ncbi:hypothetical protein AAAU98_23780 [Enterocloster citroniae]|uniref:hypothetical protein n=1 Tax=Enterocloster citroniae TaxID=358743 RepID=UPI0032C17207
MATVDEILTRQAYAAGDEIWTKDNNYPSYTMYAEPEYVPVTNKRIADFNDQVSVRGEQNAQFVGFQLPRYDDAMDLKAKNLYIHYQTVYGGSDGVPCNVSWSDNYVRLCWMIPGQATQEPGSIQMMIYATGTDSVGDRTVWKTLPATYTIHDGLDIGGGIPEPDPSWYEQFVAQMEGKVSTAQGYANDAQASKTAAAGSATAAAQSADASAQALAENKDYVESQKETFVGYNKRESDLQYANALIGSASGTGRVSVGDAWEAPIPDLEVAGKSEQVSTTGAQLLQDSNIYPGFLTNANGTRTNDNNYRTVWLSLPAGTYTLSVPGGVMIVKTVIDGILNNSSTSIADGAGYTCTLTQDGFLGISFRKQDSSDYTEEPQVMLNTGSTALPWEPYTGGQPSPSTDYPQPIISTGTVTTGAQMLNLRDSQLTFNGLLMQAASGVSVISGTPTADTVLYYMGGANNTEGLFTLPAGDYFITDCRLINYDGTTKTTKAGHVTFAEPFVVTAVVTDLYPSNMAVNTTLYPMINAGSTAKPWEPYTGGKPSPSEEYPQPLEVTVTGANLCDAKQVRNHVVNGITITNNMDESITINGTSTDIYDLRIVMPNENKKAFDFINSNNGSYCLSNNCGFINYFSGTDGYMRDKLVITDGRKLSEDTGVFLRIPSGTSFNNQKLIIMLNAGSTALPWQPYQSCTATITLTEPLHGIGDVRDRIMYRDGVWGIERKFIPLIFDGSEDEKWEATGTNDSYKRRYITARYENVIKAEVGDVPIKVLCDALQANTNLNTWRRNEGISSNLTSRIYIYLEQFSSGDLAAFKTYLSAHPINAIFERTTPTWEPLPSATQTALNALTTYTGTTHINIMAGGPEPDVAVEYVQDTKAVIADLQAQIDTIRNGGTI